MIKNTISKSNVLTITSGNMSIEIDNKYLQVILHGVSREKCSHLKTNINALLEYFSDIPLAIKSSVLHNDYLYIKGFDETSHEDYKPFDKSVEFDDSSSNRKPKLYSPLGYDANEALKEEVKYNQMAQEYPDFITNMDIFQYNQMNINSTKWFDQNSSRDIIFSFPINSNDIFELSKSIGSIREIPTVIFRIMIYNKARIVFKFDFTADDLDKKYVPRKPITNYSKQQAAGVPIVKNGRTYYPSAPVDESKIYKVQNTDAPDNNIYADDDQSTVIAEGSLDDFPEELQKVILFSLGPHTGDDISSNINNDEEEDDGNDGTDESSKDDKSDKHNSK